MPRWLRRVLLLASLLAVNPIVRAVVGPPGPGEQLAWVFAVVHGCVWVFAVLGSLPLPFGRGWPARGAAVLATAGLAWAVVSTEAFSAWVDIILPDPGHEPPTLPLLLGVAATLAAFGPLAAPLRAPAGVPPERVWRRPRVALVAGLAAVVGGAVGLQVPNERALDHYVGLVELTRSALDRQWLAGPPVQGPGDTVQTAVGAVPVPMTVIPAGPFLQGDPSRIRRYTPGSAIPARQVELPEFLIDTYEVTWAQYDVCVAAGRCPAPPTRPAETPPDDPATNVTWDEAAAFCAFAGKRLPTGEEWEKAARGTDGRAYPWGDLRPEDRDMHGPPAGDGPAAAEARLARLSETDEKGAPRGWADRRPVQRNGDRSPYGVVGMASNVGEWVAGTCPPDRSDAAHACQATFDGGAPRGPRRTERGTPHDADWCAPFSHDPPDVWAAFCRSTNTRAPQLGFRCAADGAARDLLGAVSARPAEP